MRGGRGVCSWRVGQGFCGARIETGSWFADQRKGNDVESSERLDAARHLLSFNSRLPLQPYGIKTTRLRLGPTNYNRAILDLTSFTHFALLSILIVLFFPISGSRSLSFGFVSSLPFKSLSPGLHVERCKPYVQTSPRRMKRKERRRKPKKTERTKTRRTRSGDRIRPKKVKKIVGEGEVQLRE